MIETSNLATGQTKTKQLSLRSEALTNVDIFDKEISKKSPYVIHNYFLEDHNPALLHVTSFDYIQPTMRKKLNFAGAISRQISFHGRRYCTMQ
jgi:hypothetical protein